MPPLKGTGLLYDVKRTVHTSSGQVTLYKIEKYDFHKTMHNLSKGQRRDNKVLEQALNYG